MCSTTPQLYRGRLASAVLVARTLGYYIPPTFFGVVGKERRPEIRERMRMAMACVGGKGKEWVQKRRRREERVCTSSSSSSFKARMLVASCGRRRRSLWPPGERALGQGKKKKAVCGGGSESLQAILSLAGGCEGRKTREKTRRRR